MRVRARRLRVLHTGWRCERRRRGLGLEIAGRGAQAPLPVRQAGLRVRTAPLSRAISRRTSAHTVVSGRTRGTSQVARTAPLRRATSRGTRARTAASGHSRATSRVATSGPLRRATSRTHKRTHSGEWPYPCDEPGYDFRATTSSWLSRH
ncbi:hypothetical protein T492DRAFT_490831 [Pavlovales sp. CCMP2436]|nr:hypothetical protein T492DRAFT_490831 [Pavlovales sp. CCMP2436]